MNEVKYSCDQCGIEMDIVRVRFRTVNEGVTHYVGNVVGHVLKRAHKYRSPKCGAKTLTLVMIPEPVHEGQGIGHDPDRPDTWGKVE